MLLSVARQQQLQQFVGSFHCVTTNGDRNYAVPFATHSLSHAAYRLQDSLQQRIFLHLAAKPGRRGRSLI